MILFAIECFGMSTGNETFRFETVVQNVEQLTRFASGIVLQSQLHNDFTNVTAYFLKFEKNQFLKFRKFPTGKVHLKIKSLYERSQEIYFDPKMKQVLEGLKWMEPMMKITGKLGDSLNKKEINRYIYRINYLQSQASIFENLRFKNYTQIFKCFMKVDSKNRVMECFEILKHGKIILRDLQKTLRRTLPSPEINIFFNRIQNIVNSYQPVKLLAAAVNLMELFSNVNASVKGIEDAVKRIETIDQIRENEIFPLINCYLQEKKTFSTLSKIINGASKFNEFSDHKVQMEWFFSFLNELSQAQKLLNDTEQFITSWQTDGVLKQESKKMIEFGTGHDVAGRLWSGFKSLKMMEPHFENQKLFESLASLEVDETNGEFARRWVRSYRNGTIQLIKDMKKMEEVSRKYGNGEYGLKGVFHCASDTWFFISQHFSDTCRRILFDIQRPKTLEKVLFGTLGKQGGFRAVLEVFNFGNTPLHASTKYGHVKIVEILLINGADRGAYNTDNRTPEQMNEVILKNVTSNGSLGAANQKKRRASEDIERLYRKYDNLTFRPRIPDLLPTMAYHVKIDSKITNSTVEVFTEKFKGIVSF
uniref:ANK_REP_REGION domain-containing protein n=1 Tax=Caenorhabditis japonica TaxID=281687 RepID=A0A8R1IXR0_CAEJA